MQISFLHNPPPPLSLQISDAELEVVSSVKLLGVTIQNNLKWDQQFQKHITNGSRRLYILSRLRKNGVKPNDLILIYKLYVLPILEFGAVVWSSGLTLAQIRSLERVQKRALRIIVYPNVLPHSDLLSSLNILSLSERRNQLVIKFAHNLLTSKRHRHMLPPNRQSRCNHNLRNSNNLTMPKMHTQRYKQSPVPSMIRLINCQ